MKKFEMTVTLADNDGFSVEVNNNGFNALEIIGFLEMKKQDILEQINHPEKFEYRRTAVLNDEQVSIEEVK